MGEIPKITILPDRRPTVRTAGTVSPTVETNAPRHRLIARCVSFFSAAFTAVIDSGVDVGHPELRGAVAGLYDALGEEFIPHAHGTAMAAAIVARCQVIVTAT